MYSALLIFLWTGFIHIGAQVNNKDLLREEAKAATVGISSERLKKIDEMLETAIAKKEIPGVVALIVKDGKIVYHKAFGTASSSGRDLEKDDVFRIASQTKAITATAVMMLWEEGKFKLDDPISKYIPEFKNPKILESFKEADSSFTSRPAEKEITIRHLLTHTSGLGYGMIDPDHRMRKIYQKNNIIELFTTEDISIGEMVKDLAQLPLHNEPGEKFIYSIGLDVLGYFVEVISGKPFDQFLKERLFDPLEMNDTGFYMPQNKSSRLVGIQLKKDGKWEDFPSTFYEPDYPLKGAKRFFSGGAGLTSTAKDYAAFLQMYLNGGEYNQKRILSTTTIEMMMGNHTGDKWGGEYKYHGLAFGVLTHKGQINGGEGSEGTFDWGGYFNTQYFADPKENIIGIVLKQTQGNTGDQTAWKFRQMVFSSVTD
ncbi:serine hydrolase domain-containing protein [soil metagenome]